MAAAQRMLNAMLEVEAGERRGDFFEIGGSSAGQKPSAMYACAGPQIDDMVGAPHEFVVVFDDEEGIALVAERFEGLDQAVVVARVQADAGLVEHVEDAGEIGAELRGEADALGFAAGKRPGGAVEREIAEAHMVEKTQAFPDLRNDVLRDEAPARIELEGAQMGEKLGGRAAQKRGQRKRRARAAKMQLHGAGGAIEAFAVALGARRALFRDVVA